MTYVPVDRWQLLCGFGRAARAGGGGRYGDYRVDDSARDATDSAEFIHRYKTTERKELRKVRRYLIKL